MNVLLLLLQVFRPFWKEKDNIISRNLLILLIYLKECNSKIVTLHLLNTILIGIIPLYLKNPMMETCFNSFICSGVFILILRNNTMILKNVVIIVLKCVFILLSYSNRYNYLIINYLSTLFSSRKKKVHPTRLTRNMPCFAPFSSKIIL